MRRFTLRAPGLGLRAEIYRFLLVRSIIYSKIARDRFMKVVLEEHVVVPAI